MTADNNNQENRRGKGSLVRATRTFSRSSILKMSSHPATHHGSCYYMIVCELYVFVKGTGEKREMIGLTCAHTQGDTIASGARASGGD